MRKRVLEQRPTSDYRRDRARSVCSICGAKGELDYRSSFQIEADLGEPGSPFFVVLRSEMPAIGRSNRHSSANGQTLRLDMDPAGSAPLCLVLAPAAESKSARPAGCRGATLSIELLFRGLARKSQRDFLAVTAGISRNHLCLPPGVQNQRPILAASRQSAFGRGERKSNL